MTGIHQADFVGQWGVEQMRIAKAASLPFFVHLTPLMIHEGTCLGPYDDESLYADTDPYWEKNLTRWGCKKKDHANFPCSFTASTCPTTRHAHAFDGATNPHTPMWNATAVGPLPSQMDLPPISPWVSERMDISFRNRSATLLDLDDLIGVVMQGIEDLGVADNTYVFFSGDNVRGGGALRRS